MMVDMGSQEITPTKSVYSLSTKCPSCGTHFSDPPLACPDDGTILVNGLKPGTIIKDCYEYIAPIGSGGMGIIVKARHIELDVEVAIKMLLRESTPQTLRRFKQEAKAASHLTHDNIIHIRDFGITDDGHAYMVMDLLLGENLADLIKINGALSTGETLKIVVQWHTHIRKASCIGISNRATLCSCTTITIVAGSKCSTSASPR